MRHQDSVETLPKADGGSNEPASGNARLARVNINPMTGLATDYLNHFNEAIMLLEMLASAPEFRDDFLDWQPVSYPEHFAASHFKARSTTIAAYEEANPHVRACLDALTDTMTVMLQATRAALRADLPPALAVALAERTAAALKPLVARAGAVINGEPQRHDMPAPQAAVDDLLRA